MADSLSAPPRKRSVYLVEDHELFTLGLQRMLEMSTEFDFAGHSRGVLAAVSEIQRLQPDIVLLDLQLDGESGVSLIRTLRAQGESPLIAVLTNHNDPRLIATCEQSGANAYILKETALGELVKILGRMQAGRWEAPLASGPNRANPKKTTSSEPLALASLSPREIDCMKLLAQDLQQTEVAERLHISLNTLKNHRKNIYKKMGFKTKTDLVVHCRENGLI